MKLRNVRLMLANVARTTNEKTMAVNSTGTIKERGEDGTISDKITGFKIDCAAYRGDTLTVKFPPTVADKITELEKMLEKDASVEIGFINLKLTPYALKANDGSVLSGISAKADDFTIVKTNFDELSDIEDLDIEP